MTDTIRLREIYEVLVEANPKLNYGYLYNKAKRLIEELKDYNDVDFDGRYEITSTPSTIGPPTKDINLGYDIAKVIACSFRLMPSVRLLRRLKTLEAEKFKMSADDSLRASLGPMTHLPGGGEVALAKELKINTTLLRSIKALDIQLVNINKNIPKNTDIAILSTPDELEKGRRYWVKHLGLTLDLNKLIGSIE